MPSSTKLLGGALSFRKTHVTPGGFTRRRSFPNRRFHVTHADIIAAGQAFHRRKIKTVRVT